MPEHSLYDTGKWRPLGGLHNAEFRGLLAAKDIAGKTICWSRKGARANFAANGQYADNQHRPGYHDLKKVRQVEHWLVQQLSHNRNVIARRPTRPLPSKNG
jgi:hypothetical protein